MYEQGGYPPLSFRVSDNYFTIIARSDDRVFIPKGGCSIPKIGKDKTCSDHPKQQVNIFNLCSILNTFCFLNLAVNPACVDYVVSLN